MRLVEGYRACMPFELPSYRITLVLKISEEVITLLDIGVHDDVYK